MTTKVKAAIIGSGNIGTDLLYKALRSEIVEPIWMVGIDPESEGLRRAKDLGLKTTFEGVKGLEPHIEEDEVRIAWDATSAYVHRANNEVVAKLGKGLLNMLSEPRLELPVCLNVRSLAEGLERAECLLAETRKPHVSVGIED